jgi:hypothetical protein
MKMVGRRAKSIDRRSVIMDEAMLKEGAVTLQDPSDVGREINRRSLRKTHGGQGRD